MRKDWPEVPIRQVADPVKRPESPLPGNTYRQVGVRLWGKGAYERESVDGSNTKYKALNRVERGDIVVNKIWARNGSVSVVTSELAGCYCSGEFPLFKLQADALLPDWFYWITKTRWFWHRCDVKSRGTSGKNRIRPEQFLDISIPLPPVSEQRRIVSKIESLAGKIEEAGALRSQSVSNAEALFQATLQAICRDQSGWTHEPIGRLMRTVSGQVDPTIEPYASMLHINGEVMESCTGRLLDNCRSAKDDGMKSGKYHFKPGAVLYSKIRPYLRKAVVVPFEGICSADVYASAWLDPKITPGYLKYTLIGPAFTAYANEKSGRTRMPKLNQKQLFAYQMAFPPLEEQRRIVTHLDALQAKVDEQKTVQGTMAAELDALLPSVLDKAFKGEL